MCFRLPVLRYIGYWQERCPGDHDYPDPRQLVHKAWIGPEDKRLLTEYLKWGVVYAAYRGYSWCRFDCGIEDRQMGSWDLTDGKWIWPLGLAHYVEAHDVILPDAFLKDAIENMGYVDRVKAHPYKFNEHYLHKQFELDRGAVSNRRWRRISSRPRRRFTRDRQYWISWAEKKIGEG